MAWKVFSMHLGGNRHLVPLMRVICKHFHFACINRLEQCPVWPNTFIRPSGEVYQVRQYTLLVNNNTKGNLLFLTPLSQVLVSVKFWVWCLHLLKILFHEGYWSFKIHWIYLLCIWRPKIRIFDVEKEKAKVPTRSEEKFCLWTNICSGSLLLQTKIRTFLLLKIRINRRNIQVTFPLIQKNFPLEASTNIYFTIGKTMLFNSARSHAQNLKA